MSGDGFLLDTNAIIAATARANSLTILTADDHFRKLKSPWHVKFFRTI